MELFLLNLHYLTIPIKENQITELGDTKFIVESQSNPEVIYQVDMVSGFCDCMSGMNCGPCKHKDAISKYFKLCTICLPFKCAFVGIWNEAILHQFGFCDASAIMNGVATVGFGFERS